MDSNLEIRTTLRQMLLPIQSDVETACIDLIHTILISNEIDANQHAQFLKISYNEWQTEGSINPILREVIERSIHLSSGCAVSAAIANTYFEIHKNLISDPFITFEISIIILGHAKLIFQLAFSEKMSSAKIVKVIKSIDNRLEFLSWKHIKRILAILKIEPNLAQISVSNLYNEDEKFELEYFADADILDAASIVGDVAKRLQFNYNATAYLQKLSTAGEAHLPYLQILHYQCLISGFYDHVFPILYEFNPRGIVANWLFGKWEKLLHTSNPILNNAKSVHMLDENWAKSKKPNEYEQAATLVELLKGLDEMGFAAAQELTSWIRCWLVRYIRLNTFEIIPISRDISSSEIKKLSLFIVSNPTNTYGILEQRFIDVIGTYLHSSEKWRSRGLGDSVNTNNNSKKKLGDCDFQNSIDKIVVAYEAHGGKLSKLYFDGHIRTLKSTLQRRIEDLETVASISEWRLELNFIAYDFEPELPTKVTVNGLGIEINYMTFNDMQSNIDYNASNFRELFRTLFIDPINNRRTPNAIRIKILTQLLSQH